MEKTVRQKLEKVFFTGVIVCVFIVALQATRHWPLRASILVLVLGSLGLLLSLVQLAGDLKAIFREPPKLEGFSYETPVLESSDSRWGDMEIWAWLIGLYLFIWLIGFMIAVPLFVFAYTKFYGARWITSITLSAVAGGFIYGLFEHLLHVPWPESVFF